MVISKGSDFYEVFGDSCGRNLRFTAENDLDQNKAQERRQRKMIRSKGKKDKKGFIIFHLSEMRNLA